jgi:hypothetical protein
VKRLTISLVALLSALAPVAAEPKVERTVNCVYPAAVLGVALNDLATQLGYAFEPGEFADSYELEGLVWVHAKGVSPQLAAKLDDANRTLTVRALEASTEPPKVRAFKVDALCRQYLDYQKRYGFQGDAGSPELFDNPTATEELRDAAAEVLQLGEEAPGSAVGKRLVYTRNAADLDRLDELFRLLESGGESSALRQDRLNRDALSKLRSEFGGEQPLLSATLWQLFKDCPTPVYLDYSLMQAVDFEYDSTDARLGGELNHHEALLAVAREQGFEIDSLNGALRLHQAYFSSSASYRVFDVSGLLAELEKQYAELKTDPQTQEGFQGDLRTEGGVQVVVDALCIQLDNAGCASLVRAYGSRLVVSGGVDVIDRAAEVLAAMGWLAEGERKEK